jgi:branched chain amino acid efflux pump
MADAAAANSVDTVAAGVAVLLLAAVTAGTRVGGVWLMSHVRITPRIETFLKYMSVSVLIAIVAPATWRGGPHIWIGVAMAALVMVAIRSALAGMLAGTALAAFARGFGL